jgi:RNA polymerase sigma factor (sigma-70 family)
MPTDADLVSGCLAGSQEAAEELVRRHGPAVYRLARRLVRQEAEDVAQATFAKAFSNLAAFDRQRSFKAWVMGIAKNTAISLLRARTRRREEHLDPDRVPEEGPVRRRPPTKPEEDHVREVREFVRSFLRRQLRWFCRHTDVTRAGRLRRALSMRLGGSSYETIAERCRYRTADSARISLRRAVERILDDAAARKEALTIAATERARYRELVGRPSGTVRFLNVVDLRVDDDS